jgi:hypothetical protein
MTDYEVAISEAADECYRHHMMYSIEDANTELYDQSAKIGIEHHVAQRYVQEDINTAMSNIW